MSGGSSTTEAYRACEAATRAAAANFYYGIRLLPADKRRAMSAVYAFARRIDDIGDGPLQAAEKLRRLDAAEHDLRTLGQPSSGGEDPVMLALADACPRFDLPMDALTELIEGVRMDVRECTYEDFEDLALYCRRVAGTIGRLCLAIFGSRDLVAAAALADDLGIAMQLTNITRDLREDAENGRVYVPARELVRYHLHDHGALGAPELAALALEGASAEPSVVAGFGGGDVGQLYALMRFQAFRAAEWFDRGIELVGLLDRRSAACVLAMTGIYRRLLTRIEDHPDLALRERMSLPAREKAWVATRGLLGRGERASHPAQRLS